MARVEFIGRSLIGTAGDDRRPDTSRGSGPARRIDGETSSTTGASLVNGMNRGAVRQGRDTEVRVYDSEVSETLDSLNANFPSVHELTGEQVRAEFAAREAPVTNLDDVGAVRDTEIPIAGGFGRIRLYFPRGAGEKPLPVVVFLHGGGFVFCGIESHDGFCREMARRTSSVVVSVDYRLAPEHRAPTAAWDAYHAVCWVADNAAGFGGDPGRVVLAGDSAGGNLATVACLISRERDGPEIAGQVLLYPVIDPRCDTESYRVYATGYVNTAATMEWYWAQYLPGEALPRPEHHVAPSRAPSLAGLPSAVVVTAERDPLASEGAQYAADLAAEDVVVVHRHYPGLFHGFLTIAPLRAAQSARALLWRDMRALVTLTPG